MILPQKSVVLGHVLAPQYEAAAIAPPSRACRWFVVSNTPALPRRACAVHLSMACLSNESRTSRHQRAHVPDITIFS